MFEKVGGGGGRGWGIEDGDHYFLNYGLTEPNNIFKPLHDKKEIYITSNKINPMIIISDNEQHLLVANVVNMVTHISSFCITWVEING